jgi:L-ascorbate metabolism protein UlaG (beta-lactamase superfamily)
MTTSLTVARIGHACQLIEIGGTRVLADPWFTQTATYHHGEPVASTAADLGRIDAVVVSHQHYDHCDLDALAAAGFNLCVPVIGPGTVAAIARDKGFRDVRAIEAWQATTTADVTVSAAPGQHGVHEVTFVIQGGGADGRAQAGPPEGERDERQQDHPTASWQGGRNDIPAAEADG